MHYQERFEKEIMADKNENDTHADEVEQNESSVGQAIIKPMDMNKLDAIEDQAKSSIKRKSNDGKGSTKSKNKGKENKKMKPMIIKEEKSNLIFNKIDKTIAQKPIVATGEHDTVRPAGDQIHGQLTETTEKSPIKDSTVNSTMNPVTSSLGHINHHPDADQSLVIPSTSIGAIQLSVNEAIVKSAAKSVAAEKMQQNNGKKESSKKKLKNKSSKKKKTKERHHTFSTKEMKETIDRLVRRMDEFEKKEDERHREVMSALNTILDNWNEHRHIPSDINSRILEQKVGYPEPGFVRFGDNTIHLGQGIYIPKKIYDTAVFKSKTHGMFVKKMVMTQFTEEELLSHSVTGATSNRVKVGEQKPALDPTKMRAIKDIFEFYLTSKQINTDTVKKEVEKCSTYVRSRISDARAEQRRREKELNKTTSNPRPRSSDNGEDKEQEEEDDSGGNEESEDSSESEGSGNSSKSEESDANGDKEET